MITEKEMLQAIYEEIADKTTSFGCWFVDKYGDKYQFAGEPLIPEDWVKIGHPVMIGDVLYYLEQKQKGEWTKYEDNTQYPIMLLNLVNLWEDTRLPINYQSDDCVDLVYHLIKNNVLNKKSN